MIVRIRRRSEPNAKNFNDRLHCCSESEFRQGWEGNVPEDLAKTSQRQESGLVVQADSALGRLKSGKFGHCGFTCVFRCGFECFAVL